MESSTANIKFAWVELSYATRGCSRHRLPKGNAVSQIAKQTTELRVPQRLIQTKFPRPTDLLDNSQLRCLPANTP